MPSHVLVVEDSELVRGALKTLLEANGFRVSTAGAIHDAIARAREETVDVLLLDLTLGTTDGLLILQELHASGHTPRATVALTGHDDLDTHMRAKTAGCCDVWLKPVPARELVTRIRQLTG